MRINLEAGIGAAETGLDKNPSVRHRGDAGQMPAESEYVGNPASVVGLSSAVMAAPEIRQSKVEALKAQIEGGTYQVSSQQIADSLLESMRASG